ncbi:TIGR02611 family protein [Streptomyces sp. NBC_01341]|uniref:TIGR02611 family protein n=1 Tax=Streptomyces sp. NBC_01341 TaxID=2903831 RepID=UPI002E138014|nr:TIGR02611 family protein [Streptomyces sp. NBC_01341]
MSRTSAAAPRKPDLPVGSRAPYVVRRTPLLHLLWKAGVFVVGTVVVGTGIVLLPLPGPGWLVIFGGMAVWATEFVWAQLALRWTRRKVAEATRRALDPRVRRRNAVIAAIGLVLAAGAVGVYVWRFGVFTL